MKYLLIAAATLSSPAYAESLCGVTDEATIRKALSGEWAHRGAAAYITASDAQTGQIEGVTHITENGEVEIRDVTNVLAPLLTPTLSGVVYDVDQLDDILDTIDAAWIADEVSETACGPEELPQLTASYEITEALNGRLTVVPYFSDRAVLILEAEWRGDWGIAFITLAALLTPSV